MSRLEAPVQGKGLNITVTVVRALLSGGGATAILTLGKVL